MEVITGLGHGFLELRGKEEESGRREMEMGGREARRKLRVGPQLAWGSHRAHSMGWMDGLSVPWILVGHRHNRRLRQPWACV